jgi:asparagine synthase (glutamine-hydrolysing)
MSVQAGIWNFDGRVVDPALLAEFGKCLKDIGADGEFRRTANSIAMLYLPFHCTPESHQEQQPLLSRRGFVLTWDGRLDNRDELIAELRNDLAEDPPDSVIAAAAFDRWETEAFRRIAGDWAVSVWRGSDQELIFAVDYMAIRHIFYLLGQNHIWWSSHLAPLVFLSKQKFHLDEDYIAGYLAEDPDAHRTPYKEIREVPPGQFVRIGDKREQVERYWRFHLQSRILYKSDREYEQHFRYLFRQAVRRRLRSDRPILAELSGGLDSSSIVCMADSIVAKGEAHTRVDTLSYYDDTETNGDDSLYFPKVEQARGRRGHHIDTSKLARSSGLGQLSGWQALPGRLGSSLELECERADVVNVGGYRVVLSGFGGDEFMGAIPNPAPQLADLIVQFRIGSLARELMHWSLIKRRPWVHLLRQALMELLPVSLRVQFSKAISEDSWIDENLAKRNKIARRLIDVEYHFGLWLPTRRALVATFVAMSNKMAKRSLPSLAVEEIRYPYLDQDLVEFAISIPNSQLLRPGERRSLMRRALAGLVPHEILERKTKQFGARTPALTLETNWAELQAAFAAPISSEMGYINAPRFRQALLAAKEGKPVHLQRLFKTISLELWLKDLASCGLIANHGAWRPAAVAGP